MAAYIDTIRRIMKGDFAEATDEEKVKAVAEVKQVCSVAAATVAIQPLPIVDVVLITPIQIVMVQAIGQIHGTKLDKKTVIEILSTFGTSIVAQSAVMGAAKFVPFAGWVLSIAIAYALTYAIGEVADFYFITGRGATPDELKAMFKRVYERKKAEKQAEHKSNATLKDKIEQLKEAYKSGLITEEEFEQKKEQVLADF